MIDGSNMFVLDGITVYVDVDDTLCQWKTNQLNYNKVMTMLNGESVEVTIHDDHVRHIIEHKRRGHNVVVWLIGSIKRHLNAIEKGEDYDQESGLLHIGHVLCNAMFLSEYYRTNRSMDDRFNLTKLLNNIQTEIDSTSAEG